MNAAQKALKKLESPEGQEKMNQIVREYIEKQQMEAQKIKKLMSETTYVEWLKEFTQDRDSFTEEDWAYSQEQLTDKDRENVDNLSLFYRGIENYANSNHIEPNFFDFGEFYKVKYNDFYFKIGIAYGQGTRIFFSKFDGKNMKGFINFNKVLPQNKNTEKLSKLIIAMHKNGMPIEDILNTINETITALDDGQEKHLVKKRK